MMLEDKTLLDVSPRQTEKLELGQVCLAALLGLLLAAFSIGSVFLASSIHAK